MINFETTPEVVPVNEFSAHAGGYVMQTRETGRPTVITMDGHAAGILINMSTWHEIQEKIERMETYQDILIAEGQIKRGEYHTMEEFQRMIFDRREKEDSEAEQSTENIRAAVA